MLVVAKSTFNRQPWLSVFLSQIVVLEHFLRVILIQMQPFIEHIQKSIFSPEYYRELLERPSSYSWKYYWSFTMLLSVFMTIASTIPLVPLVNNALNDLTKNVVAYYPNELVVHIDKGEASTNVSEPYYLTMPNVMREHVATTTDLLYLGVIDTHAQVSVEQFRAYKAAFWISKEYLVADDGSGGIRFTKYGPLLTYTLNKQAVQNMLNSVEPFFKFIPPILVLIIFIAMLLSFTLNLLYLLFGALLVMLMGKLMKQNWSYGTAYRLCLHATTLPLIVGLAFSLLPIGGGNIPFFSTVLLLVVVYANFYKSPVAHVAPTPPPTSANT